MLHRCVLIGAVQPNGLLSAQDDPAIRISGAAKQELAVTAGDLSKVPRASVRTANDGVETVYEGGWLHEVLKVAGVTQGRELRGRALTSCVLAEAQDGYQVLFSLAELDNSG